MRGAAAEPGSVQSPPLRAAGCTPGLRLPVSPKPGSARERGEQRAK